jgi:hypothetical protein
VDACARAMMGPTQKALMAGAGADEFARAGLFS